EEDGRDHFYFQDDLGSPMRLTDEDGRSEEVYGFDEFGNDIRTAKDIFKDSLQSFGFTGYQMDSVGALYFAQARRYDAGVGRFISEDFIKGHIAAPYTMNHYNYCWNRPLDLVDLNGMAPVMNIVDEFNNIGKSKSEEKSLIDFPDEFLGGMNKEENSIPEEYDIKKILEIPMNEINEQEKASNNDNESNNTNKNADSEKDIPIGVLGLSGSIGAGAYMSGSVQFLWDLNGDIALQVSGGTGVEIGQSGNGSIFGGMYMAPSIDSLKGYGIEEGATVGEGLILGGGAWQACDDNGNIKHTGGYGSIGFGEEGTLASGHVTMSNTWTVCSGNIFEWWNSLWEGEEQGCLE
ncbi:MAG: hypothetical protein JTJ28_11135, partial [Lactobacillus sp.]|nr:hypothetical protein [Lactobacillus sp.]